MKERPILFSGDMVRAILNGAKTQTRRVIKFPSGTLDDDPELEFCQLKGHPGTFTFWYQEYPEEGNFGNFACPYGKPGDRLWVRETWSDVNTDSGPAIMYRADDGLNFWSDFCEEFGPDYGAGPSMNYEKYPGPDDYCCWWSDMEIEGRWKPSIHMPRWAARIDLEITDVRVERIQQISQPDAKAEGYETSLDFLAGDWAQSVMSDECSDPWVWVIEFKRIEIATGQ